MTAVALTTEERLDAMSAQMDFIVEELQRQRETRETDRGVDRDPHARHRSRPCRWPPPNLRTST